MNELGSFIIIPFVVKIQFQGLRLAVIVLENDFKALPLSGF